MPKVVSYLTDEGLMNNPYVPAPAPFAIWGHGCILKRAGALSVPHNTGTSIPWDTEVNDPYGFHNNAVNPDRVTVPAGYGGRYLINIYCPWANQLGGRRDLSLNVNGVFLINNGIVPMANGGGYLCHAYSVVADLVAGDYIGNTLYQDSGSAIAILPWTFDPRFSMVCIGA